MTPEQLEQRLATIERTIGELQQLVAGKAPPKRGLQALIGSMADFPEFDELMENVRKRREQDLAKYDAANGPTRFVMSSENAEEQDLAEYDAANGQEP